MADTTSEEKIFTVKVDSSELVKYKQVLDDVLGTYEQNIAQMQEYNEAMRDNKAELKEIEKYEKMQGSLSASQRQRVEELTAANRKLSVAKSELQQVLKNEEKIMQSGQNTYQRQSQTLGKLRMAWRQMTAEQKAANSEMLASIQQLDASLKAQDAEIGNHQRNVGNYPQLFAQVGKGLSGIAKEIPALNGVSSALSGITGAANPMLMWLGLATAAVKGLTSVWKSYDEAVAGSAELTYELNDAMAESSAGADALTRHLQDTAGTWITLKSTVSAWWQTVKMWGTSVLENIYNRFEALYTIAEGLFTLDWGKVAEGGAAFGKALVDGGTGTFGKMKADQAEILEIQKEINAKTKERDEIETNSIVKRQQFETQISELERKAREAGTYSEAERLGFIRQAQTLIREKYDIEQKIAVLNRDIAILEGEKTGNSVEANQKIEQAKAKVLATGKAYNDELRQTLRLETSLSKTTTKQTTGSAKEGSIAYLEQQISEATKRYKNATTQIDRDVAAQLIEMLKEQLRDLSNQELGTKMTAVVDVLLNPQVNIQNPEEVSEALKTMIGDTKFPTAGKRDGQGESKGERNGLGMTKEQQQFFNSVVSSYQQLYSTIEQMNKESIQRRLQDELDALDRETDSKKLALKAQQENGTISQKNYERKLAQIDKDAAAKQEELKKVAFEKQKKWDIVTAVMNGALAITNILANVPGSTFNPATYVAIALAAANTAAQVAMISSQKYARGGLLRGKSHAEGGIKGYVQGNPIELEGDEVVINKRSARLFRNELSAINSYKGYGNPLPNAGAPHFKRDMKFARGGVLAGYNFAPAPLPMSAAQATTAQNEQRNKGLMEAIGAMMDAKIYSIRATVLYDDIDSIGNEKRINVSRATL